MAVPPPSLLLLLLVTAPWSRRGTALQSVHAILTEGGLLVGDQLGDEGGARCARRVQRELDSMRRSATSRSGFAGGQHQATIDLAGYALHQPLRSAPYDMYVTGMRVRVPGQNGWVRVERCQFNARNHSLDTRLLFRDLTVTGRVKLYEGVMQPAGTCTMTLRLRRAGLGFTAVPALPPVNRHPLPLPIAPYGSLDSVGRRDGSLALGLAPLEVRTDARFVDPDFVSVYAHGCPSPGTNDVHIEHRSDNLSLLEDDVDPSQELDRAARSSRRMPGAEPGAGDDGDLGGEMGDVFLKGIRTLLARYMERRLQPALRDAVMAGMGYSVSYGR